MFIRSSMEDTSNVVKKIPADEKHAVFCYRMSVDVIIIECYVLPLLLNSICSPILVIIMCKGRDRSAHIIFLSANTTLTALALPTPVFLACTATFLFSMASFFSFAGVPGLGNFTPNSFSNNTMEALEGIAFPASQSATT